MTRVGFAITALEARWPHEAHVPDGEASGRMNVHSGEEYVLDADV
jgi:hypothetical protein